MEIQGHCDERLSQVRAVFEENFRSRAEAGASVCVMLDGHPVVDLWGGLADVETGQAWERDTLVVVMSCTKGAVALCGHLLADRGELDLEKSIAHYWPEFAKHGKSGITVRQAFSHQSGVFHVSGRVPRDGFCDSEIIIRMLEESKPAWVPGTRVGYHVLTHGYLIGELVQRISGQSIGQFFRTQIAEPLGLDFHIGLPEADEHRVAKVILNRPSFDDMPDMVRLIAKLPPAWQRELVRLLARRDLTALAMTNIGGFLEGFDRRSYHAAELPSSGGITNARGLAGLYAPLAQGGSHGDVKLVSSAAIPRMAYPVAASSKDAFLNGHSCFTLGFSKSWDNRNGDGLNSVIIGEDAFGTPGFGGNLGFADPHYRLSFGYTMNRQGEGTGLNPRGQLLVDAVYQALGSPSDAPGFWVRPSRQA